MKNRTKWTIIFSVLIVLFSVWTVLVFFNVLDTVDLKIMEFVYQIRGEKGNFVYYFSKVISFLGFYGFLILFFLLLIAKKKSELYYSISAMVGMYIFNLMVKICVQRERPMMDMWWATESSFSYPSAHSAVCMCVYIMLLFFICRWNCNIKLKSILGVLVVLFPILVGCSRVFLGVHFSSDVIGGWLQGLLGSAIGILIFYKMNEQKKRLTSFLLIETKKNDTL